MKRKGVTLFLNRKRTKKQSKAKEGEHKSYEHNKQHTLQNIMSSNTETAPFPTDTI